MGAGVVYLPVRRETVTGLMGDDGPRSLAAAASFGAASSSCSYAAVALARSLFRKGASFTAAIAFMFASTNLVAELGIILALLIGWQFTLAEFVGGPLMIVLIAIVFRYTLHRRQLDAARAQAERGLAGAMEGHAAMDMSVAANGSFWQRLRSDEGRSAVSGIFVMEWAAVLRDIVIGLLIAGAVGAWIPDTFWRQLFLTDHPLVTKLWSPLIAPLVAMASFVCSVGNVPLAGVLWNGGISFGGVLSFLFADLIIIPILLIYAKYYGRRMAIYLAISFYATMVAAGYVIEAIFGLIGLTPEQRNAKVVASTITWNYTTFLDIAFLAVATLLVVRFIRNNGINMLRHMNRAPTQVSQLGR